MQRKVFLFAAILLAVVSTMAIAGGQGEAGGKPVDLTWYVVGNGPAKDQAVIDAAASAYVQKKGLNANVHITTFDWGTYDQKMRRSSRAVSRSTSASRPCGPTTTGITWRAARSLR